MDADEGRAVTNEVTVIRATLLASAAAHFGEGWCRMVWVLAEVCVALMSATHLGLCIVAHVPVREAGRVERGVSARLGCILGDRTIPDNRALWCKTVEDGVGR